jgi:hypothetical protein
MKVILSIPKTINRIILNYKCKTGTVDDSNKCDVNSDAHPETTDTLLNLNTTDDVISWGSTHLKIADVSGIGQMNPENAKTIVRTIQEVENMFPGLAKFKVKVDNFTGTLDITKELSGGSMPGDTLLLLLGNNLDKPKNGKKPLDFIIKHELGHHIDQTNPGLRQKMISKISDMKSKEHFADMVAQTIGGSTINPKYVGSGEYKATSREKKIIMTFLKSDGRLMKKRN